MVNTITTIMDSTKDFLQNNKLGEIVYNILSNEVYLPNKGIVVGQSVSSIVYSLFTKKESNYFDIEVISYDNKILLDTTGKTYNVDLRGYLGVSTCISQDKLKIHVVQRMISVIPESDIKLIDNILKSQSVNSNCICLDLTTKKLYYTNDYVDFIKTNQIEILNFSIRDNTLFQLLEKQRLFPQAYCNRDLIFSFFATWSFHCSSTRPFSNNKPDYLTREEKNYVHSFFRDNKILEDKIIYELRDISRTPLENYSEETIFYIFKILYGKCVTKGIKKNYLQLLKYHCVTNLIKYNDNFLIDLPKNWIDRLNSFNKLLKDHDLNRYFWGLTLKECYERWDIIRDFVKKEGNYVIGILENFEMMRETCTHDLWNNELTERYGNSFKETVEKIIAVYKRKNTNSILIEKLPLLDEKYDVKIVELNTPFCLMKEGYFNKHCVGGYSNVIDENNRIFSLRYKNKRFTCYFAKKIRIYNEIDLRINPLRNTYTEETKWRLIECKSYKNSNLQEYEKDIQDKINALIDYILYELNFN